MSEQNDLDGLLSAVSREDDRAFEDLYAITSAKLFAIALRILQSRAAAEDVVQDVYAEVWRSAANFDPARGSAAAWLAVICRSRAIDALRRDGRSRAAGEDDLERMAEAAQSRGETGRSVELIALLECLERLDKDHREAVLLAYYEGRTRDEIATRLDCPVNTIKTWLRRGLLTLRDCLAE